MRVEEESETVKDRYRDSEDRENKISSLGKVKHITANNSAFWRVWRFVENLLADAGQLVYSIVYGKNNPVEA